MQTECLNKRTKEIFEFSFNQYNGLLDGSIENFTRDLEDPELETLPKAKEGISFVVGMLKKQKLELADRKKELSKITVCE